jgi:hypothetical protein
MYYYASSHSQNVQSVYVHWTADTVNARGEDSLQSRWILAAVADAWWRLEMKTRGRGEDTRWRLAVKTRDGRGRGEDLLQSQLNYVCRSYSFGRVESLFLWKSNWVLLLRICSWDCFEYLARVGSQLRLYTLPAAGRGYVLRADWLGALHWL